MRRAVPAGVILAASLLGPAPSPARAETINCTPITTLPATIGAPGIYCLSDDLSTDMSSGVAITIAADNVVLDLNGHLLEGLAAGPATQATGILANNQSNITIRNGTVQGFFTAITLVRSSGFPAGGHLVELIRADRSTSSGMVVDTADSTLRNNHVIGTGGSTLTPDASAIGIFLAGPGLRVLNNDILDTHASGGGSTEGIRMFRGAGPVLEGNRIGNAALLTPSVGINLMNPSLSNALAVNNRLTNLTQGIVFANRASGKYRDNLTSGVATPFTGGTDAGNNN